MMWQWMLVALLLASQAQTQQPYFDFSKAGAGFYGAGRESPDPTGLTSVRIGVLAPAKDIEGRQMRSGVEMAVEEANQGGGYRGIPYEAVVRADDGPWGVAAGQLVSLAYEDKVWAVIGGIDGSRTHVAELVASKAWIPVITPASSDSSVDYANVPWVFRCVPADGRQVDLLLGYAERKGYRNLVAITETQRDGYTGFLRLQQEAWREHRPLLAHLQYPSGNPESIVSRLHEFAADALVVWGSAKSAAALIRALRAAGVDTPILGPSELAGPELSQLDGIGNIVVAAPCDLSRDDAGMRRFVDAFRGRTGMDPSAIAMYAYDSARLTIDAVRRAGLNRARIRDELASGSFQGITGRIEFNSLRGNTADPVLMTLQDGHWVRLP
jgi:ABC-type branched-subunit amino acid transport system substrate-binding protein